MSAILSPCGLYRYRLEREVQTEGQVFAFFGVNPSTADADVEDATTKKWRGFCLRNGARRYIAGNPFAFRATDVKQLATVSDPVGAANLEHIMQIIADADVLIPCWGSRAKLPPTLRYALHRLKQTIHESGKPVRIFGLTKTLDPIHPLMLGYDTPLIPWTK
jgi:hypothetical protein